MKFETIPGGGVTIPSGFLASGMHAGIKKNANKFDTSLIYSEAPCVSAGMFTSNQVKAWPLLHNLRVIGHKSHRVIFANSGNANCFNGKTGQQAVSKSLTLLSKLLKVSSKEIFLGSTGVIGRKFPVKILDRAIPALVKTMSKDGGHCAARGILTTDTNTKEIAVRFKIDGKTVCLAAMAKGAGMIYPDMTANGKRAGSLKGKHATMLCYGTTDLNISKAMLQSAVNHAVRETFNKISIDNDQSTNDMVLVLANAKAGNPKITRPDKRFRLFQAAVTHIFRWIAQELVSDGEGVTHVCEIIVKGARKDVEATTLCRQIATSMLVKTMFAGGDPNWGRLMGCVGASGVSFSPKLDILFEGIPILRNGKEAEGNKNRLRQILKKKQYRLEIDLKRGRGRDSFLTTDLTKFYVWINSRYST